MSTTPFQSQTNNKFQSTNGTVPGFVFTRNLSINVAMVSGEGVLEKVPLLILFLFLQ